VRTDDTTVPNLNVQHMDAAVAPTGPALGETSLTLAEVQTLVNPAIDRLSAALALGPDALAKLRAATIQVSDLPGLDLGITAGDLITLSPNAAGWGWFVDPTPFNDGEFPQPTNNGFQATPASPAYGKEDLLTVLEHEFAHILGYQDTASGLMSEILMAGTRLATPVGKPAGQVFDEGSGSFVSLQEAAQLQRLLDGRLDLLNTNHSSDWIVRGLSDDGTAHQSATRSVPIQLGNGTSKSVTKSSALNGGPVVPSTATNGHIGGGLINWNKSFIGSGLSRL